VHHRKPPLIPSGMAHVRGIKQFHLLPTRLSKNGMNHPAFTRWRHPSEVAHIRLQLTTTHLSTTKG